MKRHRLGGFLLLGYFISSNVVKKISHFLLIAFMLLAASVVYAKDQASEAKIKAAYINQFSHFVHWSEAAGSIKKISICVLGIEDVSKELQPLTQLTGTGFTVKLHKVTALENIEHCNMLYIAKSESGNLKAVLGYVDKKPVLTISSINDFAREGGMIGFVIADSKVRLEINPGVVNRSGLNVSARLLEVSRIIETEEFKGRE